VRTPFRDCIERLHAEHSSSPATTRKTVILFYIQRYSMFCLVPYCLVNNSDVCLLVQQQTAHAVVSVSRGDMESSPAVLSPTRSGQVLPLYKTILSCLLVLTDLCLRVDIHPYERRARQKLAHTVVSVSRGCMQSSPAVLRPTQSSHVLPFYDTIFCLVWTDDLRLNVAVCILEQ
jgi:hypothetical protein